MNVAVVIVNYRTPQLTLRCVEALLAEKALLPGLRAIVVDGGSDDGSAAEIGQALAGPQYRDWVSFLPLPINGGFGWANNQAILGLAREQQPPEFIYLLNPDAEVMSGAVGALLSDLAGNPRCAAAGSQLLNAEGCPTASAFRFPSAGREFINAASSEKLGRLLGIRSTVVRSDRSADVDWVTGASVMFRAAALRETGLFDDGFFLYFDEVELMHRLHARGWTVRHVAQSRVRHLEAASTGVSSARPFPPYWYRSRQRYFTLTGGRSGALAADLGLLAGRLVRWAKSLVGRAPDGAGPRPADFLRSGFWPRADQAAPSIPAWGDDPGRPPVWMQRSEPNG